MSEAFLEALKQRRSYYNLEAISSIPDSTLQQIIESIVLHTPTAFNTQTGRIVILTKEAHKRVWSRIKEVYLPTVGSEEEKETAGKKMDMFGSAYGSLLFFEDESIIEAMYEKMPNFKSSRSFDVWSENSTGMLQYACWTALELHGFGCNLQHHASYKAEVQSAVLEVCNVSEKWKCTGLMPFGKPIGGPGFPGREKTFEPIEKRVRLLDQ